MSKWFLVILAVALEGAGIAALFAYTADDLRFVAYLAAHAVSCALLSVVLVRLLPGPYRGQPGHAWAFLMTLQFAIPFVGSLGVALGILLALYLPHFRHQVPWQEVEIPELPFRPIDMSMQMTYSQGGLRQVLREATDPEKRLAALMATRQMANREAVGILREALKDKVDDVRLLAYSMLDQKEKILTQQANRLQQHLQQAAEPERSALERRLAQLWWEMAYLGLAQGGLRTHYFKSARELLQGLVDKAPQHSDWRLLGRVELALGNIAAAERAFEAALANGAPHTLIFHYYAECAFARRDFERVSARLTACAADAVPAKTRALAEAWR